MAHSWPPRALCSLSLDYDGDEDWLDVAFERHEGRTIDIVLNDHITLTTDEMIGRALRLQFREYARMLLVSETEFTALRDEDPEVVQYVLELLSVPPASTLLELTDPDGLIARVGAPAIDALIGCAAPS